MVKKINLSGKYWSSRAAEESRRNRGAPERPDYATHQVESPREICNDLAKSESEFREALYNFKSGNNSNIRDLIRTSMILNELDSKVSDSKVSDSYSVQLTKDEGGCYDVRIIVNNRMFNIENISYIPHEENPQVIIGKYTFSLKNYPNLKLKLEKALKDL